MTIVGSVPISSPLVIGARSGGDDLALEADAQARAKFDVEVETENGDTSAPNSVLAQELIVAGTPYQQSTVAHGSRHSADCASADNKIVPCAAETINTGIPDALGGCGSSGGGSATRSSLSEVAL